ncbi:MAG: hypothetical protein NVS2B12_40930 [Ktedonobacteraceae bacterium]
MYHRVISQPGPSSMSAETYSPETLRSIGTQVEALVSRHSILASHKRAIEWQLASIAAQIQEQDVVLIPRSVFLLLEIRGSGGVSNHLKQISHILYEQGYWKPRGPVQNYHLQEVYHLGRSAQRLFDDYAVLDRRVKQLNTQLRQIKERWHIESETTLQGIFASLATVPDTASFQCVINEVVELLERANHPGLFRHLFLKWKKMQNVKY